GRSGDVENRLRRGERGRVAVRRIEQRLHPGSVEVQRVDLRPARGAVGGGEDHLAVLHREVAGERSRRRGREPANGAALQRKRVEGGLVACDAVEHQLVTDPAGEVEAVAEIGVERARWALLPQQTDFGPDAVELAETGSLRRRRMEL